MEQLCNSLNCYYLFLHIQYFKYDPLTNIFNRSVYVAELEKLKNTDNVSVVSLDLDRLKEINDAKGYKSGDAYIISLARLMKQCFADIGNLYRIGGMNLSFWIQAQQRIYYKIKLQLFMENVKNGVSVSCGYSFHITTFDLEQMLCEVDKAMYDNKICRKMNRLIKNMQF